VHFGKKKKPDFTTVGLFAQSLTAKSVTSDFSFTHDDSITRNLGAGCKGTNAPTIFLLH